MITNTFCHVPGVGLHTEAAIWGAGILTWEQFHRCLPEKAPMGKGKMRLVDLSLKESMHRLQEKDAAHFAQGLPSDQLWRLFADFRPSTAYLDIETTGMAFPQDHITTIALYDGKSVRTYVHGDNLMQFKEDIQDYRILVSYNGKSFDVPFIRNHLGAAMDHVHIDLRHVLRSLGYRGGLKACERQLGIDRGDLDGVDGFLAVLLWQEYVSSRRAEVLETLLAYNVEDAVNLEQLMVMAFNMKLERTPFTVDHALPSPVHPIIPFKPHPEVLHRTMDRLQDLRSRQ